jgi:hypothetical protein
LFDILPHVKEASTQVSVLSPNDYFRRTHTTVTHTLIRTAVHVLQSLKKRNTTTHVIKIVVPDTFETNVRCKARLAHKNCLYETRNKKMKITVSILRKEN